MFGRLAGALLAGALPIGALVALDASDTRFALAHAWPPFVLVAGLLLVGAVAGHDGLFDAAAARLVLLPGSPVRLLLACLALVSVVTALLNLDTAAVFLTPILVKSARRRGVDVTPFLYGSVFMANASSLFLPGSNLTNLLVLSGKHISGAAFFARMLTEAIAAPALTAAGLLVLHRRRLRVDAVAVHERPPRVRLGLGLCGSLLAAGLMVALRDAALPVLLVGLLLVAIRAAQRELTWTRALSLLNPPVLVGLFVLAVALGALARASSFPADALHAPSAPLTAAIAALASVLVNNLPAAVLLSTGSHLPTRALLLGLNVGPNLAVTGSLAVLLWWRSARAAGASPSAWAYSRQGLLLAPLALVGALALGAR